MLINEGELLLFSNGEYSDYGVMTLARATKPFNIQDRLEAYLKCHPEQRERYEFDEYGFLAYLTLDGTVVEVEYREVHLGCYGTAPTF